jgi:signal transduction histidine kinase
MSRRLFLQVIAPALLIGLLLLGACLASVWSIGRLQTDLAHILRDNVASLEAAQELEIRLRQMRFHTFLYAMDPAPARRELVEEDQREFGAALERARASSNLPEEQRLVEEVAAGYRSYRDALATSGTGPLQGRSLTEALRWADAHPVHDLQAPCRELVRRNKEEMDRTAREGEAVGERVRSALIFLALAGPVGGLALGFGITRGLSRSIAQLRVRVQDVHAQLDREVGSVRLDAAGDLGGLDRQLGQVVERVRDVVGQLQRQQWELLRAEQLAAVGGLAAGVAHEVRNPLTAIKMLVGAALHGRPGAALTPEDLRVIHGEIERLERTVQNLLDCARPPAPRREECDLRDCVSRALDLVRARARQQGVVAEVHQPAAPVRAEVDPDQFGAVLINLFLNALDAMPTGGRLEITLEDGAAGVRLTVSDSGPGIAPGVAGRLFTPFSSTKPAGTGLGLSVCRRVLRDHGGEISAENRAEGGARFTVTLPVERT